MKKKESLNKKGFSDLEGDFNSKPSKMSGKMAHLRNGAFGVIKFILGVCLLPFVYSSTVSFLNEISPLPGVYQHSFWYGIITFLLVYHFVWEPVPIYAKGHKLLEMVFSFFSPLVKVAPFLLPIYTILCFIAYALISLFVKPDGLLAYSMFFFGFTIALHLVFSAKSVRTRKDDFLKGNYVFGFSFIYILNVMILAAGLSFIFKEFSFLDFSTGSFQSAKEIFSAVFAQLFIVK